MSSGAEFLERIKSLAQEVTEREGCRLYDVEMTSGARGRILRVYIDRREGQVSLEDCSNVSRGLNLLLDVEDIVPGGSYDLEVSSPGLERKLLVPWHFETAIGQRVRIRLTKPVNGGHENVRPVTLLEGELSAVGPEGIRVRSGELDWSVGFDVVAKANVRFVNPEKKGKKR